MVPSVNEPGGHTAHAISDEGENLPAGQRAHSVVPRVYSTPLTSATLRALLALELGVDVEALGNVGASVKPESVTSEFLRERVKSSVPSDLALAMPTAVAASELSRVMVSTAALSLIRRLFAIWLY